jgi:hypothetical protein
LFLVALAPDIGSAQPADWQKTWNETLAAAKKEGKVVVAGPPDAQVRQALPAAFEERYGFAWNISVPAAPIRQTSCGAKRRPAFSQWTQ